MAMGSSFSGGFMSDTSAMDTSIGGTSEGQPKRETRSGGTLVPVTALMIQRAVGNKKSEGDDFIINGEPVKQVRVVGQVMEIREAQTTYNYTLNDSSGAQVEVKRWINVDDGVKEQNLRADVREGMYCCVVGNLRSLGDKAHIGCYVIFPIITMNEITRHLLEVAYVNLAVTRAHYSSESMQVETTSYAGGDSRAGPGVAQIHSGLSPIQKDIFELLRACQKHFGMHVDEIVGKLCSKYSAVNIRAAVEFLCSEGLVYSSCDDNHYQATE